MAEAVVGLLIGKLGEALASQAAAYGASLLCTEASALRGLFGEVDKAKSWLDSMKASLEDSEKFRDSNKATDAFVKKIRGLAFRIEDVVDEFKYKLEDEKHGGFAAKVKKRIQHVKVWSRLASKLRDINVDLELAAKQRNLCVMPQTERYGGGRDHHATSTDQTWRFAREENLVGIEHNAEKLKGWLLGDLDENKSKIVTVWGMGGAGKTTLVRHVYNTVKEDFHIAAWVTVSKSYNIEDLLKTIATGLDISRDISSMDKISLGEVISNRLQGTRYILVLDDVWETDVWIDIMDVFPNDCMGRFVFTSRNLEVASMATSNCVIQMVPLEQDNSWKLFCNLVLWNREDKSFTLELQNLAVKFLEKCDGLPLAIACIGRLLSCKPPTFSEWTKVYQELESHSTKHVIRGVDSILKVSLEDLSYELKNCFLHCAMFPEDYEIQRRRLIRHWITAGFIKEEHNKTLEEVAEGFLNELVNRSLLQVIEKNEFGRVRCCRMHDIIRHLALKKAEEECFGNVYEGSRTFSKDSMRRLSIQRANISQLSQSGATHLRAIYAFTSDIDIDLLGSILASSSLLSTLDLQGTQIKVLPKEVFSLFNLRFLGIRMTRIEILPEAIGRLQNLEVLDAFDTGLISLPKGVAKLKKLRSLHALRVVWDGSVRILGGVKVPRGIGNLTRLHALQDVKASLETLCDVAALTELRKFSVSHVKSEHYSNLCSAIMNMRHLIHLEIAASDENEILPLEALHLPETLTKLSLTGQLVKKRMPQILSSWSHLSNLRYLYLSLSKFDGDSFSRLVVLCNLCALGIYKAYDGNKLRFPVQSFPKLLQLHILDAPHLNQLEIEEGALENLKLLEITRCPELKCLPGGIEDLTALEELYFTDTSEELLEKLRQKGEADECNNDLMKIRRIKTVVVRLTKKNIWERILLNEGVNVAVHRGLSCTGRSQAVGTSGR